MNTERYSGQPPPLKAWRGVGSWAMQAHAAADADSVSSSSSGTGQTPSTEYRQQSQSLASPGSATFNAVSPGRAPVNASAATWFAAYGSAPPTPYTTMDARALPALVDSPLSMASGDLFTAETRRWPAPIRELPPSSALPPDVLGLVAAYFDQAADPSFPLLHRGRLYRSADLPPFVLVTMVLVALKMAPELPMLTQQAREDWQHTLCHRARAELKAAMETVNPEDFLQVLRLLIGTLLFMTWADAKGMHAMDRSLHDLAVRIVLEILIPRHSAILTTPWEDVLCAAMEVESPGDAEELDVGNEQLRLWREAWIDYWEIQNALVYLLKHSVKTRARTRDVADESGAMAFSQILEYLYSPPTLTVWQSSFADNFDPRFCPHQSLKLAPFINWIDLPLDDPERAATLSILPVAILASRSVLPFLSLKLRMVTGDFLNACQLMGVSTPADAIRAGREYTLSGTSKSLLDLRDQIDAAVGRIWWSCPEEIRTSWKACDPKGLANYFKGVFGDWDTGIWMASLCPVIVTLRLETRTSIGLFLSTVSDPLMNYAERETTMIDLDAVDLSDEYADGEQYGAIVPELLIATRFMEALFDLKPALRTPATNYIPVLLEISLFHVACFRQCRSIVKEGGTLLPGVMPTICSNLGICLSLLKKMADAHTGSFVEQVYNLVKTLLEQGKVSLSELDAAEARLDHPASTPSASNGSPHSMVSPLESLASASGNSAYERALLVGRDADVLKDLLRQL